MNFLRGNKNGEKKEDPEEPLARYNQIFIHAQTYGCTLWDTI